MLSCTGTRSLPGACNCSFTWFSIWLQKFTNNGSVTNNFESCPTKDHFQDEDTNVYIKIFWFTPAKYFPTVVASHLGLRATTKNTIM
jgi:hypothetical protein